LDELIGNLQTYELRRNSQQKEKIKKDRGIALKVMEEDSSDLDVEEMAMITRKFKEFSKKAKDNSKRKSFSKLKNSDREQFSGCFKCGKLDHIVKTTHYLKRNKRQNSPGNRAGNRLGTVLAGVSQEQCLRLGEIQQRKMKGLRRRMQP